MSSNFTMKYSLSSKIHQFQVNCSGLYTSLQAKNKFLALESGLQPANSQKYYGDLKGPVVTTVRIKVQKDSLNKIISWNGKPAVQE